MWIGNVWMCVMGNCIKDKHASRLLGDRVRMTLQHHRDTLAAGSAGRNHTNVSVLADQTIGLCKQIKN